MPYSPKVYSDLPPFSHARAGAGRLRNRLAPLGRIFTRHGLDGSAMITSLHGHFRIGPSERMRMKVLGNEAVIRPTPAEETTGAVPRVWKTAVDRVTGDVSFFPLEFLDPDGAPQGLAAAAAIAARPEFFDEIGRALAELGLEDDIGVAALVGDITPGPNGSVLETTDEDDRELRLSVQPTTALGDATETNWVVQASGPVPVLLCIGHCNSHTR